jgi:hypothetical protein
VDFQFGYVGEAAGNATGGLHREVAYADQWAAGVTLDLGRRCGGRYGAGDLYRPGVVTCSSRVCGSRRPSAERRPTKSQV